MECTGLLGGINSYHIRVLVDSEFNGGGGLTFRQVGEMTLDQIWCRFCDLDLLKKPVGERVREYSGKSAMGVLKPDADGFIKGRDDEGRPMKAKMGGKSLCRRLMEEEEKRKAEKKTSGKKKRCDRRNK